jgi:hypothetical protein
MKDPVVWSYSFLSHLASNVPNKNKRKTQWFNVDAIPCRTSLSASIYQTNAILDFLYVSCSKHYATFRNLYVFPSSDERTWKHARVPRQRLQVTATGCYVIGPTSFRELERSLQWKRVVYPATLVAWMQRIYTKIRYPPTELHMKLSLFSIRSAVHSVVLNAACEFIIQQSPVTS